jgi:hypothetical protein
LVRRLLCLKVLGYRPVEAEQAHVARMAHEQTMWWRWNLGIARTFGLVIIAGRLLGNPCLYINSLPRITVGALLLASNGALLLQGERLRRISQMVDGLG